jgi:Na+-driven multidrug efflux pump
VARRAARQALYLVFGVSLFFGGVLALGDRPPCKAPLPVPDACKQVTHHWITVAVLLVVSGAALTGALLLRLGAGETQQLDRT